MNFDRIYKYAVYCMYKIGYFGKINFQNLNALKDYKGPAIIIANHQYKIDLFIPVIWNILLNRRVHSIAAAYAFQNGIKAFIAKQLNIIFVTKSLDRDELRYIADKLAIDASQEDIERAYNYHRDLATEFNSKAHEMVDEVLSDDGLIFTFTQSYQPFFEMEKASEGIGRLICKYSQVPVFPVSIVDKSKLIVETRTRNSRIDLRRIDLLTDKRRKYFAGEFDVIIKKPLILNKCSFQENNYKEIIDEVMTYISSDIPISLRGYYKYFQFTGNLNFFSFWESCK